MSHDVNAPTSFCSRVISATSAVVLGEAAACLQLDALRGRAGERVASAPENSSLNGTSAEGDMYIAMIRRCLSSLAVSGRPSKLHTVSFTPELGRRCVFDLARTPSGSSGAANIAGGLRPLLRAAAALAFAGCCCFRPASATAFH